MFIPGINLHHFVLSQIVENVKEKKGGIISKKAKKKDTKKRTLSVAVWDFAGQEVYVPPNPNPNPNLNPNPNSLTLSRTLTLTLTVTLTLTRTLARTT